MDNKVWRVVALGGLVIALLAVAIAVMAVAMPQEDPTFGATSCTVYREQGCAKMVVASGGELEVQSGGTLDIQAAASLNVGSLYPLGFASSGKQLIYGTSSITGTATAAHGLTTVTAAWCSLGEDPETGAGDAAVCSVTVSANVVTVKAWQDDFAAATETDVVIHWLVVGTP